MVRPAVLRILLSTTTCTESRAFIARTTGLDVPFYDSTKEADADALAALPLADWKALGARNGGSADMIQTL